MGKKEEKKKRRKLVFLCFLQLSSLYSPAFLNRKHSNQEKISFHIK